MRFLPFRVVFCPDAATAAGLAAICVLLPAVTVAAHPCDSSKHKIRDGKIHSLEIVDAVDRDGDGYYSSFNVKLVSDTRVSRPRRKGKKLFRDFYKFVTNLLPGPVPPPPGKGCVDLIPGYLFKGRVQPLTGRLEDTAFDEGEVPPVVPTPPLEHQLGVHKPHSKGSYPGPGRERDVSHFLIAPILRDSNDNPYVDGSRTHSGQDLYYLEQDPKGLSDLLPGRWTHGLLWIGVETCWRIWARGKARYTGGDRCLTPDDFGSVAKAMGKWATGGGSKASTAEPIRIERPEHDEPVSLRVESDPSGAQLAVETRPRVKVKPKENGLQFDRQGSLGETPLGTTAWQGELPPEAFEQGMALHVSKAGHEAASRTLSPGDRDGTLRFDLEAVLAHTLVIDSEGVSGETDYEFEVTGELRQVDGAIGGESVSIQHNDAVQGKRAAGHVANGRDGFRFDGEITAFELADPLAAAVFVDGEQRPALEGVPSSTARLADRGQSRQELERIAERAKLPDAAAVADGGLQLPGKQGAPNTKFEPDTHFAPNTRFSGRWYTNFEELRVVRVADFVVGEHTQQGVLAGRVTDGCIAGVFTKGARNGVFRFEPNGKGAFRGRRGPNGQALDQTWDGVFGGDNPFPWSNFTRDGTGLAPSGASAPKLAGRYDSNYGALDIVAARGALVGDYADRGILAGVWNGESFMGRFTNDDRTGWFRFPYDPDAGQFGVGRWGWLDADAGGQWRLDRESGEWPELDNLTRGVSCG